MSDEARLQFEEENKNWNWDGPDEPDDGDDSWLGVAKSVDRLTADVNGFAVPQFVFGRELERIVLLSTVYRVTVMILSQKWFEGLRRHDEVQQLGSIIARKRDISCFVLRWYPNNTISCGHNRLLSVRT